MGNCLKLLLLIFEFVRHLFYFSALIDRTKNTSGMKTLKLVALMSGFQYKWKIKIRLIRLNTPKKVEHVESTTGKVSRNITRLFFITSYLNDDLLNQRKLSMKWQNLVKAER